MVRKIKDLFSYLLKRKKNTPLIQELEEWVEESRPGASPITDDERHLLSNVFQFRGLTAHDIMKPRADIQGLDVQSSFSEVVNFFRSTLSLYAPVYHEQLDETLGLVYLHDILPFYDHPQEFHLKDVLHDVLFVSPSIRILELMIKMRVSRANMALVVDEFGGIDGLVTLEDVIEEIVGKIQESQSLDSTPQLIAHEDGSYMADARLDIKDLEALLGTSFHYDTVDEDIQTLGGLLTHLAGRVPTRGELIRLGAGFECEVRDADPRRVKQVLIRPAPFQAKPLKIVS